MLNPSPEREREREREGGRGREGERGGERERGREGERVREEREGEREREGESSETQMHSHTHIQQADMYTHTYCTTASLIIMYCIPTLREISVTTRADKVFLMPAQVLGSDTWLQRERETEREWALIGIFIQ